MRRFKIGGEIDFGVGEVKKKNFFRKTPIAIYDTGESTVKTAKGSVIDAAVINLKLCMQLEIAQEMYFSMKDYFRNNIIDYLIKDFDAYNRPENYHGPDNAHMMRDWYAEVVNIESVSFHNYDLLVDEDNGTVVNYTEVIFNVSYIGLFDMYDLEGHKLDITEINKVQRKQAMINFKHIMEHDYHTHDAGEMNGIYLNFLTVFQEFLPDIQEITNNVSDGVGKYYKDFIDNANVEAGGN